MKKLSPVKQLSQIPNPGPLATPEQAGKARVEAENLLRAIWHLNLPYAAKYIRANPPSAEAIAIMGFHAHERLMSARARYSARQPRKKSLRAQMRTLDIQRYSDIKKKAPKLLDKYTKLQLTQAISKAKGK